VVCEQKEDGQPRNCKKKRDDGSQNDDKFGALNRKKKKKGGCLTWYWVTGQDSSKILEIEGVWKFKREVL